MKITQQEKQVLNTNKKLRFIPISLAVVFILWIIIDADLGIENPFVQLVQQVPWGDKVGHLCIFASLTLLANYALSYSHFKLFEMEILTGSILVLGFALTEEGTQSFFPTRTFDFGDILGDLLGILGASMLVYRQKMTVP